MADHPVCRLSCGVAGLEDATHDVRVVRLEIMAGGPFHFSPGQYASVTFDTLPPRDYSMANRPDQARLEFHIRHTRDDGASGYVARELRLGDRVKVEDPMATLGCARTTPGQFFLLPAGRA